MNLNDTTDNTQINERDVTQMEIQEGAVIAPHAKKQRRGVRWMASSAVVGLAALAVPMPGGSVAQATSVPAGAGVQCTNTTAGSAAGTSNFLLVAEQGYISTPDGNSIAMWSYRNANGGFQYPGPVLCVAEGDVVSVTLENHLPGANNTSIDFLGQEGVTADGAPLQPEFSGLALTSRIQSAAVGTSVTYSFTASNAGTYTYQSATNAELQRQMGLAGIMIVRPASPLQVYGGAFGGLTKYTATREFVHMLSEIDPDLHLAVENGATSYDMTKYRARYFMINGRSFPDTLAPAGAPWLPSQPYDSLVRVLPNDIALVRYANFSNDIYPFHPHGNHETSLGQDGRQLVNAAGQSLGLEKFATVVVPGGTIESTFTWNDVDYHSEANLATLPQIGNRTDGGFWSGSPLLGGPVGGLKPGEVTENQCGEFYHVAHSHALFQATNYGASGGGMLTLVRIDAPGHVC